MLIKIIVVGIMIALTISAFPIFLGMFLIFAVIAIFTGGKIGGKSEVENHLNSLDYNRKKD